MGQNIDVGIRATNETRHAFRQAQQDVRRLGQEGRTLGQHFKEIQSTGRQLIGTLKGLAVGFGAAFGIGFSFTEVVRGIKAIIDEANEAEASLKRLAIQSAMFNVNLKETQNTAKGLAAQMKSLHGIAESVSFQFLAKGMREFGLSASDAARAFGVAAEMEKALKVDLAGSFDIVAGAIGGSEEALKAFGKTAGLQIKTMGDLGKALEYFQALSMIRVFENQLASIGENAIKASLGRRERGEMDAVDIGRLKKYDFATQQIKALKAQLPELTRMLTDEADAWAKSVDAMREHFAASQGSTFGGPAAAPGIDRAALAESRFGSAGRTIDTRSFAEELEEIRQHAREVGTSYTQALQTAVIDGLDPSMGWGEAWKNLGANMRNEFVGQMTGAAFDPIKGAFGEMTTVIAKQFNVVGKAIANIFAPVLNIVGQVVAAVIEMIITITGIKAIATALGGDVTASAAEGAATLSATWGAAAVAASVATLGGALANVPLAIAAMAAGAAAGAGFAAGGMAEGGIVMPRPGGVLATIAEAGQPEMVIPLDRADEFGFGGGRGVRIGAIYVTVQGGGSARDTSENIAAELDRALRRLGRERLA